MLDIQYLEYPHPADILAKQGHGLPLVYYYLSIKRAWCFVGVKPAWRSQAFSLPVGRLRPKVDAFCGSNSLSRLPGCREAPQHRWRRRDRLHRRFPRITVLQTPACTASLKPRVNRLSSKGGMSSVFDLECRLGQVSRARAPETLITDYCQTGPVRERVTAT